MVVEIILTFCILNMQLTSALNQTVTSDNFYGYGHDFYGLAD